MQAVAVVPDRNKVSVSTSWIIRGLSVFDFSVLSECTCVLPPGTLIVLWLYFPYMWVCLIDWLSLHVGYMIAWWPVHGVSSLLLSVCWDKLPKKWINMKYRDLNDPLCHLKTCWSIWKAQNTENKLPKLCTFVDPTTRNTTDWSLAFHIVSAVKGVLVIESVLIRSSWFFGKQPSQLTGNDEPTILSHQVIVERWPQVWEHVGVCFTQDKRDRGYLRTFCNL